MKKLGILLAIAMIFGLTGSLSAQTAYQRRHNINRRQARQERRIATGVRTGRLTPEETERLMRQENKLNRRESKYRASGGRLTWKERQKLNRSLNRESRTIYRQKHDR
jgi:hypothetical protein